MRAPHGSPASVRTRPSNHSVSATARAAPMSCVTIKIVSCWSRVATSAIRRHTCRAINGSRPEKGSSIINSGLGIHRLLSDGDALALAARERDGVRLRVLLEPEAAQELAALREALGAGKPRLARRHYQVVEQRAVLEQRILLRHHPDPAAADRRLLGAHQHLPAVR